MELLGIDGEDLAGGVRKGFKGDSLRLFIRVMDAFARLGEVSFEGLHWRRAILDSIGKGEAGKLPAWIAVIQVDFTGKLAAAWR